jgi:DNA-directed RNA polymerase subunit H (RpoH/RPB5)
MYQVIKEMIEHRGYTEYLYPIPSGGPIQEQLSTKEVPKSSILIALKKTSNGVQKSAIYVKLFENKLELNVVREFLANNFIISEDVIKLRVDTLKRQTRKKDLERVNSSEWENVIVEELIIVCKSYQNSHTNEFRDVSKHIQIIRSDFFNVNVTKISPTHQKVDLKTITEMGFKKHNIPIILSSDPQCVFNNFKKGDLIRVIRRCGEISYRIVK